MKATFEKLEYSEQYAINKMNDLVADFQSKLKEGYSIIASNYSVANGCSIYITVQKENELPFEFRVSDHENGVRNEIVNTGLSYKLNSSNIYTMFRFFGDMTAKEARIVLLQEGLAQLGNNTQTSAFKMMSSELNKLLSNSNN